MQIIVNMQKFNYTPQLYLICKIIVNMQKINYTPQLYLICKKFG